MNVSEPIDVATADRLRELAARFQQAWQAHADDPQSVDLASFLPPLSDPERLLALLRLIPLDLEGRWQNGVPVSLEDYLQRFPELGPLDRVPAQLIADEYRIRARFGVISPHSVLRQRFPKQFGIVEKLIHSDPGRLVAETVAPKGSAPASLSSGMILLPSLIVGDHYQLNRLIGRGGFGEVWHATDLRGSIDKAIKILTRSADSDDAQKEFESLNIVKKINHPCLLRTESYFIERDRLFIVLELADATMRDVLKKTQTESQTGIAVDALLVYMKHAAEGLDFLHRQGILHRDIKPENILIVGDYGKVADFGLAKTVHNKHSTKADFAGTVIYSAPETWDGRVTTRSDQYSLAATYFELRTGRVLFGGKTFQEIFRKHMEANRDYGPLPDLEQIVLEQALSKKPEDRFATCTAFVQALEHAVLASGSKVVPSQPPVPPAPTHKNNAESTLEADSAVSRVNAGLRAAAAVPSGTEKAVARKWNDAPVGPRKREKRGLRLFPWIAISVLLAAAGFGAYAVRDQFSFREPVASGPEPNEKVFEAPPRTASVAVPARAPAPAPEPKVAPKVIQAPLPIKIEQPKPPPPSPARIALDKAKAWLAAKDFAQCKSMLDGINVMKDPDDELKREGRELYAQLLVQAEFSRAPLRSFIDAGIADDPEIKPAFADAMTRFLVKSWSNWPKDEEWNERIDDCSRAQLTDRMVMAIKTEALLETSAPVDQTLPAPIDDEAPFIAYVRARLAHRQGKRAKAAEWVESLPMEDWLVAGEGHRALRAAHILQDGAAELRAQKVGELHFFASVAMADRASRWHERASMLSGNRPLEKPGTPDWRRSQLNSALAAACKGRPDFKLCKSIGDTLTQDENFDAVGASELALAHPLGFRLQFDKVRSRLAMDELALMLQLGEVQLKASQENSVLRTRHALLSYTKGRLLDRDAGSEPSKILEADKIALELDAKNMAYVVAVGRDAALVALSSARKADEAATKIKECQKGLADSQEAGRKSGATAELWPDLIRLRGLLYLEIGREAGRPSDWTKPAVKQAFQGAVAAVEPAFALTAPNYAEIAAIMAQAHESLAYLSRDNIAKNFEKAAELYSQAVATQPRFAFERGRCLYRWATDADLKSDKETRRTRLRDAIGEFEKIAQIADFPASAEASYWEALAHWDRLERTVSSKNAKLAFERSLSAAAKDPRGGGAWAPYALQGLVEMTRRQAKEAPGTSAEWLIAVLPAWQSLSKAEGLGADERFVSVGREYQDLLAETSAEEAERLLKFNSLSKYRYFIDHAVAAKHSSRHAIIAVSRAVHFRKHQAELNLTPADTEAAHRDALAAIEAAMPATRELLLQRLKAGAN